MYVNIKALLSIGIKINHKKINTVWSEYSYIVYERREVGT